MTFFARAVCRGPFVALVAFWGTLMLGPTSSIVAGSDDVGLVAHWPLDGNCVDATGHGNDCIVVNASATNGKIGGAYRFDGVDDELQILATPALQSTTTGAYTISAWFLLTEVPTAKFIVDAGSPELGDPLSDQRGLRFHSGASPVFKWITTQGPGCHWPGNGTAYCLTSSVAVSTHEWHHVAGVYEGTAGRVYVDGVLAGATPSIGEHPQSTIWKIGNTCSGGTGTGYFPGLIDEVRVYSRALSEEEVSALAQAVAADAGVDRSVDEGTPGVILDGTRSWGEALSFEWQQIAGSPEVVIADPTAATTGFDAPFLGSNATITFQLTVSSANLETASDTVEVTIVSVNDPPIADAGDDFSVKEGAAARLDGTNSYDPNNDVPLSYLWTQVQGPATDLGDPTSPTPSFVVPTAAGQQLVFQLVVSDGREASMPQMVRVTVVENAAPQAHAGEDQTRTEGAPVTLNGLGSFDPDGDGLSYRWQQIAGTQVELSDVAAAAPLFHAPFVGSGGGALVFRLSVIDHDPVNPRSSAPDEVVVWILNANDPPRCDLGRPSVSVLWPPNHKTTSLRIEGVTDPDGDAGDVTLTISGVTQDEPTEGLGDGDTAPDAVLANDGQSVLVRAERSGRLNGRVHQIGFTAFDGLEACSGFVSVSVPVGRKDAVVDDGQAFDSTQR